MNVDRKRTEEEKIFFKTNVLVPNTKMCEDGATVAATPTFSLAKQCGQSRAGRTGSVLQRLPNQWETPIKYR